MRWPKGAFFSLFSFSFFFFEGGGVVGKARERQKKVRKKWKQNLISDGRSDPKCNCSFEGKLVFSKHHQTTNRLSSKG